MPLIPTTPKDRVILGLMTFGPEASTGARVTDLAEFGRCLDRFQERGYNEVDTARVYVGHAQEAFTRAAGWKDRGLTLATKFKYPDTLGDNQAAKVAESLETSLSELGTDCVDVGFPVVFVSFRLVFLILFLFLCLDPEGREGRYRRQGHDSEILLSVSLWSSSSSSSLPDLLHTLFPPLPPPLFML